MSFVLLYLSTLLIFGFVSFRQRRSRLEAREALSYAEHRLYVANEDPTGNTALFDTLEWRVHVLNKRLARLLESPRLYLRARRLLSVLDLSDEELTAEMDVVHLAEAHDKVELVEVAA